MNTILGSSVARAARAHEALRAGRMLAPSTSANVLRNARAEVGRHEHWASVRDAVWRVVDPLLSDGARVGIVGAGNGDDLPLERLARRARELVLIDLDEDATHEARRRQPRKLRGRISLVPHDITCGRADAIARAAHLGRAVIAGRGGVEPLPGSPFDLVIGDLFYSQLLYPGLLDLAIAPALRARTIRDHAPGLTRAAVARLHVSAGDVLHLNDPLGWWRGHPQPIALREILALAEHDLPAALELMAGGVGPTESDPRAALAALGIPHEVAAIWRWPFAEGVDYLTCATLAGTGVRGPGREA